MANTPNFTDPFIVRRDTANGIATNGDDSRYGVGGLAQPAPGNTLAYASGILPSTSTTSFGIDDFSLTASTPASMFTVLNFGNYVCARSYHGVYLGASTAPLTIQHPTASPSNPRIDYVVVRIRDGDVDGSSVTRSADVQILSGTPAPTPVAPDNQLTDGDILISSVLIRAATTTITTSDLSDRRLFVTARGGITPKTSLDTRPGAYVGQYRDNTLAALLERWDGTNWVTVASPSSWTQFTPRLLCTGTSSDINIGTGATLIGRYILNGKTLTFNYYFVWGAKPYNGGTGDIYTLLPGNMAASTSYLQWCTAHLYSNNLQTFHAIGQAGIGGGFGSRRIQPMFPIHSVNMTNLANYRLYTTANTTAAGSSIPNVQTTSGSTTTYGTPDGGYLSITGVVELASTA